MQRYYTGIGSRETPTDICHLMTRIAAQIETENVILRSGHADGADIAFENGVSNSALKEIWLPWTGFNGATTEFLAQHPDAYALARQFHPAWDRCSNGAKALHARNCHQILGADLETPSHMVICWTKDGKASGGTGQAMRLAKYFNIPIHNLYYEEERKHFINQIP